MKLQLFGEYFFEFMLISFLLIVSIGLVIPFVPVLIGVVGYLNRDINTRRYRDIFINIKENWKIIFGFSLFETTLLVLSILNVFYFNTQVENINYVMMVASYIALIFAVIYLITGPTIILNMNVNLKQLIYNGFILFVGNIKNSLGALILVIGLVIATLYLPYIVIFMLYFVVFACSKLMKESFYILKANALGVTVEKLKQDMEVKDDYFEEISKR